MTAAHDRSPPGSAYLGLLIDKILYGRRCLGSKGRKFNAILMEL